MPRHIKLTDEGNAIIYQSVLCIMATNDMAHSLTIEFVSHIKKTPLYKQRIKQIVNNIQKDIKNYTNVTKQSWTDVDYYNDLCELVADEMRQDFKKFEFAVKNVLDKANAANADLIAKLEVTRTMVLGACITCDEMERLVKKHIPANFKNFRLTNLAKNINRIEEILGFGTEKDIDLSQDENCQLALQIIEKKLQTGKIYADAINQLQEQNQSNLQEVV